MTIETISEFLGVDVDDVISSNGHYYTWSYNGPKLKYQMSLDTKTKNLAVSADPEYPFGFESLVEVVVNFDQLNIETEEQFYGKQKILVARRNHPKDSNYKVLMVVKWPSGELSIWPQTYEAAQSGLNEYNNKN